MILANPNKIAWTHYQDIQTTEVGLRKQFDAFMASGQYAEAIALLKTNEEKLRGRAYVAKVIQRIVDGIKILQEQFNTNVPVFLSDLAAQYYVVVDNFGSVGEWANYTQYQPYNFVMYQGEVYMSLTASVVGQPPADDQYWLKLGLIGDKGTPGMNVKVRFNWSDKATYQAYDLVVYGSDIYVAVKTNTGVTPGTDEATWQTFAVVSKGKFNVGVNPPENPQQNTIWFKTETDPLASATGLIGQMYRYRVDGTWDLMYPATFFTLIEGQENYAPIAYRETITLAPNSWGVLNGAYASSYSNYKIKANSLVEVSCGFGASPEQYWDYSNIDMALDIGMAKFTIPYKPTQPMVLNITIQ